VMQRLVRPRLPVERAPDRRRNGGRDEEAEDLDVVEGRVAAAVRHHGDRDAEQMEPDPLDDHRPPGIPPSKELLRPGDDVQRKGEEVEEEVGGREAKGHAPREGHLGVGHEWNIRHATFQNLLMRMRNSSTIQSSFRSSLFVSASTSRVAMLST